MSDKKARIIKMIPEIASIKDRIITKEEVDQSVVVMKNFCNHMSRKVLNRKLKAEDRKLYKETMEIVCDPNYLDDQTKQVAEIQERIKLLEK